MWPKSVLVDGLVLYAYSWEELDEIIGRYGENASRVRNENILNDLKLALGDNHDIFSYFVETDKGDKIYRGLLRIAHSCFVPAEPSFGTCLNIDI